MLISNGVSLRQSVVLAGVCFRKAFKPGLICAIIFPSLERSIPYDLKSFLSAHLHKSPSSKEGAVPPSGYWRGNYL